jgi:hypothetical protein
MFVNPVKGLNNPLSHKMLSSLSVSGEYNKVVPEVVNVSLKDVILVL